MPTETVTISASVGLRRDELAPVRALLARCNTHDGTELFLALKTAVAGDDTTPFYLLAREAGALVGVVELVGYREIEGTILVEPARRRRGLGRWLATEAARELARRELTSWLLACDEAFPGGAAFASALGGERTFYEHRLTLDPARVPPANWHPAPLDFRRAHGSDGPAIAAITAAAFSDPPDAVLEWIAQDLARPDRRWFLGLEHGVPVGSLRVIAIAGGADITAFGVLPQHQGRGHGRAILSRTIALLLAEGVAPINIEVETENATALGLYRSCGFVPQHTYGYYRVATAPGAASAG